MFEQLFSRKNSQWLSERNAPKKRLRLQKIPSIIYKCRKAHLYLLWISFFLEVNKQQVIPVWKAFGTYIHVIFHVPFWPTKYKKYTLFIMSNLADKSWKLSNCWATGQAKNLER